LPRNPRPHKAYGFGPVEQIVMTVNIALRRQVMQLLHFTDGNVPPGLLNAPDGWNVEQISQFQEWFDSVLAGNTGSRSRLIWGPSGAKYQAFKEAPYKDDFDEWLARIVCYAFSLPPTAFTRQLNRATAETSQDTSATEGLAPLMLWVKRLVDHVIQDLMGEADLEFAWGDLRPTDPAEQAKIIDIYVRDGIYAVNEARNLLGLDPVPGGDLPMIYGTQGGVPLGAANGTKIARAAALRKHNPDEPRVPAGSPDGGQWTNDGGAGPPGTVAPDKSSNASTPTNQSSGGNAPTTVAELTIPWGSSIDAPAEVQPWPSETTPTPFDFPGAERRPPPSLPTNPFPRDPECAEEWAHAYDYCERMRDEGKFQPGYPGPGKDMRSCLLGQVSERCGGNIV
jgi:hypothetical protein